MIEKRSFDTIGGADHGWLKAKHHFSFAGYHEPRRMGWGALRVWNDDEIAAKSGKPILLHPARKPDVADFPAEKVSKYEIWTIFGWPYETSVTMARLIFSGVMTKYPKLKVMAHHLGAMIPFFDELARVTAPGGHLVLSFSAGPETPIWVPPERLRRELDAHGFTDFADFEADGATALLARRVDRL